MIVGAAGHRPDKLSCPNWSGYLEDNPLRSWIRHRTANTLISLNTTQAYSGMALGYDQDFARVCIELNIPFIAAVPFAGQEADWPEHSQKRYRELLNRAFEVIIVSEGGYAREKMHIRNQFVVDRIEHLLACWDGTIGGTSNTVRYAQQVNRAMTRIDPNEFRQSTTGL